MKKKHETSESRAASELRLGPEALSWSCDPDWLPFSSTEEVEPIIRIVGQDDALEALRFGLEIGGPGENVFVRGLAGTGRVSLVHQLVDEIRPHCGFMRDRCYVHNFRHPERPQLISFPAGRAKIFERHMEQLIEFIATQLVPALESGSMRAQRAAIDERIEAEIASVGQPFEEELKTNDLVLLPVKIGDSTQPVIMPMIDGQPAPPDRFVELRKSGRIGNEEAQRIHERIASFGKRFAQVGEIVQDIQLRHRGAIRELYSEEARRLVGREAARVKADVPNPEVHAFLDALLDDLVERRLPTLAQDRDFTRLYRVNVVNAHEADGRCPVDEERVPSLENLLGRVDREFMPGGASHSDHMMIQAGALLRADGGYLILEAGDVLAEPDAWLALIRTLRNGQLEIRPADSQMPWPGSNLNPEPIDLNVKVVLIGDPDVYQLLNTFDAGFSQQFKVLVDFESSIERNRDSVHFYAGVLARIAKDEELRPFERDAVAALAEYGARIAARRDRLTMRFGRLADIAREAAYFAQRRQSDRVERRDVREAVRHNKRRAELPARHFRRQLREGIIRIVVDGRETGQVNGLAVIQAGPMTYGFPTRITATIGPGSAGTINIERESQLSGAIHTKGFYILGGLMRHLLRTLHPLTFSASIAFEQSYGGIDGDSASGAEICCLLSALTGVPLRQDLAMTGAIDQHGHVQPVGAVTEKIEGFFDACVALGLTGKQGALIPRANAGDLMLREDVVQACSEGRFHVFAVDRVEEALEIFADRPSGVRGADGRYPEHSLLGLAEEQARMYWGLASGSDAQSKDK